MTGLPRSIIKKYGVTKKAWEVFRGSSRKASRSTKGVKMGKRKKSYSRGGFGMMGGILSPNNILGSLGGAYVAPMLGFSPQLGAAAGSYFIGKQGVKGAVVGYIAAPIAINMLGGALGGRSTGGSIFL